MAENVEQAGPERRVQPRIPVLLHYPRDRTQISEFLSGLLTVRGTHAQHISCHGATPASASAPAPGAATDSAAHRAGKHLGVHRAPQPHGCGVDLHSEGGSWVPSPRSSKLPLVPSSSVGFMWGHWHQRGTWVRFCFSRRHAVPGLLS